LKIKLFWNVGLFMMDNRTELFSVENAKESNFTFTRIRNNICIAVPGRYEAYIDGKTFEDED